jgi:DNA-binding LacI/PurR family transcriptional regulator
MTTRERAEVVMREGGTRLTAAASGLKRRKTTTIAAHSYTEPRPTRLYRDRADNYDAVSVIFDFSDLLAAGALQAFARASRPLTTVRQPMFEMGVKAAQLALRLAGPSGAGGARSGLRPSWSCVAYAASAQR